MTKRRPRLDVDIWDAMAKILPPYPQRLSCLANWYLRAGLGVDLANHARYRAFRPESDEYGSVHMILFGDFNQLPPATSKPPFIAIPRVHLNFDFRVLRQNRRVIADDARKDEIESFHET